MIPLHLIAHIKHNDDREHKHQKSYDFHIVSFITRRSIAQKASLLRVIAIDGIAEIRFSILCGASSLIQEALVGEIKHCKLNEN